MVACAAQSGPHPASQIFLKFNVPTPLQTGGASLLNVCLSAQSLAHVESVRKSAQSGGPLDALGCGALDMYTNAELFDVVRLTN